MPCLNGWTMPGGVYLASICVNVHVDCAAHFVRQVLEDLLLQAPDHDGRLQQGMQLLNVAVSAAAKHGMSVLQRHW